MPVTWYAMTLMWCDCDAICDCLWPLQRSAVSQLPLYIWCCLSGLWFNNLNEFCKVSGSSAMLEQFSASWFIVYNAVGCNCYIQNLIVIQSNHFPRQSSFSKILQKDISIRDHFVYAANERRRYIVMSSPIGQAYTQNDPCSIALPWGRGIECPL